MAISLNDPGQTDLANLFGQSVAENSGSEVEGLCLEVQERRNKINVPSLAEVAMTYFVHLNPNTIIPSEVRSFCCKLYAHFTSQNVNKI